MVLKKLMVLSEYGLTRFENFENLILKFWYKEY